MLPGFVQKPDLCNALAGVKARRWRLGSLWVGRITWTWQQRGGRAPYSAVLLCTSTTRGMTQDGRLSLQGQRDRSKKICTKAEASQRRSLKVTRTLLRREASGSLRRSLRESPLDKWLRESLSGKEPWGLWECPTRLLTGDRDQSQDLTKSGLRPNVPILQVLYRQSPKRGGLCDGR